jgi:diacylglycerol kinase
LSSESGDREKSRRSFSVAARIESFRHAFRGIASLLRSEHNAWLHCLATLLAIVLGLVFGISREEWLAIVLAIVLVWTAEAINTAIEALCDVVSPERDPRIKKTKDIAAGAVLFSAFGALGVGLLIFAPRLFSLIES